jgi:hypothetical protein
MPANSRSFPWLSYYGNYDFFEARLKAHSKVSTLTLEGTGLYNLILTRGSKLRVFVCECYAFGIAEYHECIQKIGQLDAVVIDSAWCGYSDEAKLHCRAQKVGLFKIGEFMAALNVSKPWAYLTTEQKEHFEKQGWA